MVILGIDLGQLRIPAKNGGKKGRRDFGRSLVAKIGGWKGYWTDAIEIMTNSDSKRVIHGFSRGRIWELRF